MDELTRQLQTLRVTMPELYRVLAQTAKREADRLRSEAYEQSRVDSREPLYTEQYGRAARTLLNIASGLFAKIVDLGDADQAKGGRGYTEDFIAQAIYHGRLSPDALRQLGELLTQTASLVTSHSGYRFALSDIMPTKRHRRHNKERQARRVRFQYTDYRTLEPNQSKTGTALVRGELAGWQTTKPK